jgi:hypothetical protein
MAQALATATALCPLCGDELSLDIAAHRVPLKWRGVLFYRDRWTAAAEAFAATESVEGAAARIGIPPAIAEMILGFLCREVCGCRRAICTSCLDDYRNAL